MQASLKGVSEISDRRLEMVFSYCCVWSFGGAMFRADMREAFSNWWLHTFGLQLGYPTTCSVCAWQRTMEQHFHTRNKTGYKTALSFVISDMALDLYYYLLLHPSFMFNQNCKK